MRKYDFRRAGQQGPTKTLTAAPKRVIKQLLGTKAGMSPLPLSRTTRVSRYQKGKPIWILLKQETVSGSNISWAVCKSAPRCRQITTPAPHRSVFTGRVPFLPPNQQRQSTEGLRRTEKPISETACCQGCRVPLRPATGRRGERGRIATPLS